MWMMPLHLHVNQKSDYDDMILFPGIAVFMFAFITLENNLDPVLISRFLNLSHLGQNFFIS